MAKSDPAAAAVPASPQTPACMIVSRRDGFRRAGIAHSTAPTIHEAGTFTEDQFDELVAEPMLIVTRAPAAPVEQTPPAAT